ncbi:Protein FecR [Myxococcaceae bacterium]|nr:Protein FecR [Myxococcaceae bacterium]
MHADPVETSISNEAIEWFSKLHSGLATSDDHRRFETWRKLSQAHLQAYADVEAFWTLLGEPARRVFEQEEAQAPQPAATGPSTLKRASPGAGKPLRRAWAGLSLAAALGMALWLPAALRFWASDYHTRWGERRELTLEDGSRVSLNTHSALSVEFSPERRAVKLLEGEAYFQVAHNPARPFTVATAHGVAKVTGTAFNVYAQGERMTVTVSEGRVKVYAEGAENQAVNLTAGLQASGDANGIGAAVRVDDRQATAWREDLLAFEMRPLASVVGELNRYFPGRIMVADPRLRGRVVSGAFDLSHPRDVLAAIEKTLSLGSLSLPGGVTLLYQSSR